jgi:hypothetical protein
MEHRDEGLSTRDIAGGGTTASEPQVADESRVADAPQVADEQRVADAPQAADAPQTADEARFRREEAGDADAALLPGSDQQGFMGRWEEIQIRFVDDPRRAVEDADQLVAVVMQRLADGFAEERERLEGMWGRGEDVGTEDLRVALQRYRSFFRRLLSA